MSLFDCVVLLEEKIKEEQNIKPDRLALDITKPTMQNVTEQIRSMDKCQQSMKNFFVRQE